MRVWLKRIAYGVATIVALVIVSVGVVYALSEARFRRAYTVPDEQIAVTDDSATLARGDHIVNAIAGCADCHGAGLRGGPVMDAPPMGRLVAVNLTKGEGGVGAALTPAVIERAVRHGVGPDGRALRLMPSDDYQYMSDADMTAVIAYMQHLQPVSNVLAPSKLMLLPRALLVAGAMPLLPAEEIIKGAPKAMNLTPAPTVEYGQYLSFIGGCHGCHGPQLSGGAIPTGDPSWPPAANLTPSGNLSKWSEAQFVNTLRTGKRPDGTTLKDPMPWRVVGQMTDPELHALWLYLGTVPSRPYGTR